MRKLLKWTGRGLVGLVAIVLLLLGGVYGVSSARMSMTYTVPARPITVQTDSATLAQGRHLATIRGCVDCHAENLGGRVFLDDPMIGRVVASNLTAGRGGVGTHFSAADYERAIRHGVRPDGSPLLVMPSQEFYSLSDEDVASIIAYIMSASPVDSDLPGNRVGPLGRALYLAGQLPLYSAEKIDHNAERPTPPPRGETVEYGEYMAISCTGCHAHNYAGGKIPGTPPEWPAAANITPDPQAGIGTWTEADFFRALREGKRPDGSAIDPFMPVNLTKQMTDEEIRAIWLYLQTVPPVNTTKP